MSRSHLDALRSLLEGVTPDLASRSSIECKHFFSGAAAYANGRIFMTLTTVGRALKLPEESRAALTKRGAQPPRYFAKAPVKKDYVILPQTLAKDDVALASWIKESIRFSRAPKSR